jgi:hypothetical protein
MDSEIIRLDRRAFDNGALRPSIIPIRLRFALDQPLNAREGRAFEFIRRNPQLEAMSPLHAVPSD